jgi:membrane associated rhomboid family serine protease
MSEHLPICNLLVITVTCLVSWLAFRNPLLEEKYIFDPEAILAGKEYFRLVTSSFLHSGWPHLILNMASLYCFGGPLEIFFGAKDFLLIYFGGMIGGDLLSLYVHRHHVYRSYGASGGVCGVLFAYVLLFPGANIGQFLIPLAIPGWLYCIGFVVMSFFAMKAGKDHVGHDAHLGGAILGLLIAAALHPRFARANGGVFVVVLSAAVLLLIYLWFNPLFLSLNSFFERNSKTRSRQKNMPFYKREALQIDAILEKINVSGLDSLSPEERELLLNTSAKFQSRAESKKPESGLAI